LCRVFICHKTNFKLKITAGLYGVLPIRDFAPASLRKVFFFAIPAVDILLAGSGTGGILPLPLS
jgi:hypothetical protein